MIFSGLQNWHRSIRSLISRSAARTRRKRRFVPLLAAEVLEDRTMLSISTLVLESSNDVVFRGDADVDTITFSVSGTGQLQRNLGGSFGFNSNSDLDAITPGDQTP